MLHKKNRSNFCSLVVNTRFDLLFGREDMDTDTTENYRFSQIQSGDKFQNYFYPWRFVVFRPIRVPMQYTITFF